MGCSVDGFIAGPGDDISFLERAQQDQEGHMPAPDADGPGIGYEAFIADIGAMLMGRNTYNVVAGFDGPWPYGDMPILVATTRPFTSPHPHVTAAQGSIEELVAQALQRAQGKDVYLDGGNLIRQALDAGLVDELIITMVPILLGQGTQLFAGLQQEHLLEFTDVQRWNQKCVQWVARPRNAHKAT